MRYVALIFGVLAVWCGLVAYILNVKLTTVEKNLSLLKAQNLALETEVRNYNEKSLQANRQIGELKKLIQTHKEDNTDGYRCLGVAVPDDVVQFLRN